MYHDGAILIEHPKMFQKAVNVRQAQIDTLQATVDKLTQDMEYYETMSDSFEARHNKGEAEQRRLKKVVVDLEER